MILTDLVYMLNLIMVMFRKDNRGLHDMVVGSKVIQVNKDVIIENVEEVKEKETIKEKASKKEKRNNSVT